LETHAAPLRDAAGRITCVLGVARDVTRRREAEERLALSLKGSDLAMTDWHIPSDALVFGEGWTKLLGYRLDELQPHASTLAGLMNTKDALAARDAMVRHLKGETPFLEAEVRLRHKDGRWIWVLARGMAVERAPDGRAVRVAGTAMDITARKRAEAEVARLSQWNELLLNSAGEGIYGVDREGFCTFINPVALVILGFAKEEVLGKKQHPLFHHHHKDGSPYPEEECPIYRTLRDGVRREVEDAFIRKNGEVIPVQLTVTPMHENGQIVGVEAVFQDIGQRKAMEQELMRLATTDPLTGAANRRHFFEQLEMELARIKRFGKPAAFLMVDLDHFKNINDIHGHAAGDKVLEHFAGLARLHLRRVDLFGRLGGEEFGILLPGTDGAGALQFAERFRGHVADTPVESGKGIIPFTISIGVAEFDPSDAAPDSIMARADGALYRAKESGRNAVKLFAPGQE
jgi:diguanylate cyclase (GGDEF)-like protein/PAS domain S-box-containing protein